MERRRFIKWLIVLISAIVVTVVTVIAVLMIDSPKKHAVVVPQEEVKVQALSLASSSAEPRAMNSSYTLTATVVPATATDPSVDWSVSWKNPSSTWANGKSASDYITVSANGLSATVTLKAAFGEQAVVTVRSYSDSDVYATCTVDYVQRLSIPHGGGYMDVNRIYQNGHTDQYFSFGSSMAIKSDVVYSGASTVRGTIVYGQLSVYLSPSIQSYIKENVSGFNSKYTFKTLTFDFTDGLNTNVSIENPAAFFNFIGNPSDTSAQLTNAFIRACELGGLISLRSVFTYRYGNLTVQSGSVVGDFTPENINRFETAVSDISLNNIAIAF